MGGAYGVSRNTTGDIREGLKGNLKGMLEDTTVVGAPILKTNIKKLKGPAR